VWGSGMLASLMNRYLWIIWLGGGILGYVAAEMLLEDPVVSTRLGTFAHSLQHAGPLALGAAVAALGWWRASPRRARDAGRQGEDADHEARQPTRRRG
jgi:predicted tellurium resistance membrane protein TerC